MYEINSKMKIGDIILINSNTIHSKVITKMTDGDFSHACLVVSPTLVLEAIGDSGVQLSNNLRFFVENKENISVRRVKNIYYDEKLAFKLHDLYELALEQQSKGYDLKGALLSVIPTKSKEDKSKFFCSELVAEMYKKIGISLFDKETHKVVPNDFIRCDILEDVTDDVVTKIEPYILERLKKNPEQYKPLDSGGNTVSIDAKLHRDFVDKSKKTFKKNGLRVPEKLSDIVEILTDQNEYNLAAISMVDKKITKLYDSYKIVEKLRGLAYTDTKSFYQLLSQEVDKYGFEFAMKEKKAYMEMLQYVQNKDDRLNEILAMYKHAYKEFHLKFAKSIINYYKFIINLKKQNIKNFNDINTFLDTKISEIG